MRQILLPLALIASPALAAPADDVSEARLHARVEALVAFGTRHTLSAQDDPRRGIGAAAITCRLKKPAIRRCG